MKIKISSFLAACAVMGATVLPVLAQSDTSMKNTMPMTASSGAGMMMDDTMRSYIAADAAGRAQMMAPMTLRQQIDFMMRLYKTPVTGAQMVSLGMVAAGMADPNNMAGTTTGNMGGNMNGAMSGNQQLGVMQTR